MTYKGTSYYERQKAKQRWRTANDPEYREMHREYSRKRYKRLCADAELYEKERKKNHERYLRKKEQNGQSNN